MKAYKIAVINGDGIGHEIVPACMSVLAELSKKFSFKLEASSFEWGAGYYKQHGHFLPGNGLEVLKRFDAIYFGAVGLPEVDDTLPFRLFTNYIRTHFKQYVNYRPVKLFDGISSPLRNKGQSDIDFVIIRENNEGEFVQSGRQLYPEDPEGLAMDTSIFTRKGIERVAHYSFQLARRRRKHLKNVTKSNTLINTLAYWDRVIEEVSKHYPDVAYRKMYVDAASANFVLHPEYFDVLLTTNMIGDILSDLGGAIMGSLGLGGSGNINPEKEFPSMFEPIHGSAPDIAGQNKANPVGQLWAGALMLEHLGEIGAAKHLMQAINQVTASSYKTLDLGGTASTTQITRAIAEAI
ncbi:MAG: tartrate dehydrogenase [Saprospiraceae bacterium]|nr:tartrate dehydrogenase [Saprospiraceae bacterium]